MVGVMKMRVYVITRKILGFILLGIIVFIAAVAFLNNGNVFS